MNSLSFSSGLNLYCFCLDFGSLCEANRDPESRPKGARLVTKMASDFDEIFGSVLDALSEALKGLPCVTVGMIVGSRGRENHRL